MDWAADLEITSKKGGIFHTFRTLGKERRMLLRENDLGPEGPRTQQEVCFRSLLCGRLLPTGPNRRSTQNVAQEESKSDDDLLESPVSMSAGKLTQPPVAPPRTRKTGWGDELKSGRSRGASNMIEQERSRGIEKDPADDIPIIPDLDEIQEDSALSDINTPTVNVNRVTAYKELDTDLVKNAAFTSLNGVNLSLLAEKLYNENLTKEPDEVWNWNLLFTQVASEINSEAQKKIST